MHAADVSAFSMIFFMCFVDLRAENGINKKKRTPRCSFVRSFQGLGLGLGLGGGRKGFFKTHYTKCVNAVFCLCFCNYTHKPDPHVRFELHCPEATRP